MVIRLLERCLATQKKSILLIGPRQTGKSTLLRKLKPDLVVNLASEREYLEHSSQPSLLEELVHASSPKTVMVNEIQRLPSMLNTIQAILDKNTERQKIRFFLSGSSARKLKRGHANLLPGRIISYRLGGLSALEVNGQLQLKKSMAYGFLPEPFLEKDNQQAQDLLRTYSAVYLKEEVQAELLVRNILGFSRFLHTFAQASGSTLDLSKLATKAKVSRTGAFRFLEILEETLIAIKCESFQGAESADVIKHPRFYFFDPGVLNGLLGSFDLSHDRVGILFEHAVIAQLVNSAAASNQQIEISYFRTRSGVEVDFIAKLNGKLWAIEAKVGQVDIADTKSLQAFQQYVESVHRRIVVVPDGSRRKLKNDVEVLSLSALMEEMFQK